MADATEMVEMPCGRCGKAMQIDKALIPVGVTITPMHEACLAPAPEDMRRFKVTVSIHEIIEPIRNDQGEITVEGRDEPVAGFGEECHAPSFMIALPSLTTSLSRLWERVTEHAAIVDAAEAQADPS